MASVSIYGYVIYSGTKLTSGKSSLHSSLHNWFSSKVIQTFLFSCLLM